MRRDRYWWDDACAFVSMIILFLQIVSVFMHVPDPRKSSLTPLNSVPNVLFDSGVLSHMDNIAAYYLMATTFYAIIWFVAGGQ